jgi:hypothetical protein
MKRGFEAADDNCPSKRRHIDLLKQGLESDVAHDDHHLRRCCVDKEDVKWLKEEIVDLKECTMGIGEILKEEVVSMLHGIVYDIREMS